MRQGDRHDRHNHEYRQKRAAQKRRTPDQILHVLGRSLEAEAEGRGQDAQLKGPGDEVLKHGSSLRNATSLGSVGADRAAQRSEHQPRPRDIIPMMTPTSSAPAIVPRGLRRAIPSSSDVSVLACSLAAEASSDPASVTPLVALPTCEATVWLMLRAVFATSPPTCDASRANVSFSLATSRRSLLISALKPSGATWSGST